MRISKSIILLAAAILSVTTGCQSLKSPWKVPFSGDSTPKLKESDYVTPVRMAVIWTPAVLNNPGHPPTRGMGGRIYFYDGQNKPVAVQGQLVVYGYNDTTPGAPGKTPERKFAFTPEQFTKHFSPTQLGPGYSIWIPWDRAGEPQMEISLVPVFTAASGQLVMGQPSPILLPGPTTAPANSQITHTEVPLEGGIRTTGMAAPSYDQGVQQASFQGPPLGQPSLTPAEGTMGIETMSITLPGTMAERLAQAPQQISPMQRLQQNRMALTSHSAPPLAMSGLPVSPAMAPSLPGAASPQSQSGVGYQPPTPQVPRAPTPPPAPGPRQTQQSPSGPQSASAHPASLQLIPPGSDSATHSTVWKSPR